MRNMLSKSHQIIIFLILSYIFYYQSFINNFNISKLTKRMATSPTIRVIEYRNGIYQGQVKSNKKNGYGILVTDQNTIIVSQWKNDMLSGKGLVIFTPEHYGFGQFNRGQIQGSFLFRQKDKTLFAEFNMSRPINKMVFLNHEAKKIQTIIHKAPIFEVVSQKDLVSSESQQIFSIVNKKFPSYSLLEFLQKQMAFHPQSHFKLKQLNNGNIFFYFDQESNPNSLGFCLNKNEQIVSCGMYVSDKISGLGCKYQNGIRYEGMFDSGQLHGVGLRLSQGKYTFGSYENGNLLQALYIDDRSSISEQKLQQFKKLQHIKSLFYDNAYIKKNLIKFKGLNELIFQVDSQQQYMYPIATSFLASNKKQQSIIQQSFYSNVQNSQLNKSSTKNLNNLLGNSKGNSNTKNLAFNILGKKEGDRFETKSSKEYIGRMNNSSYQQEQDQEPIYINTKTTIGREKDVYYKNPEDGQDLQSNASSRLRNLRKFKH